MLKLDLPEGLPTGCLLIFSGEAQFPCFWIANRLWEYTTKTSVETAAIGRPSNTTFQLSLAPCFASSGMSVSTDPTLCTSASLYLSTPCMAAWLLLFGTFLQNTTISPYLEGTWNPTKSYFLYISHTGLYVICIFRLLCAKNEDLPYAGAGPHHWPRLSAGASRSGSCNQTSPSSLQQLAGGGDDPPHVGGLWILWSYPVASHLLSLSDKSWKLQFYFANLFGILGNAGGGFHDEAWLSLGSSHCQTDERAVRVLALRLKYRGPWGWYSNSGSEANLSILSKS